MTGGSTKVGGACLVVTVDHGLVTLPALFTAATMYW